MNDELQNLKEAGLLREVKTMRIDGANIFVGGCRLLNFASNDYLGIAARKDLQSEFLQSLKDSDGFVLGSTSSRLLAGNFLAYEKAEAQIGASFGKSCLFFNSGYHANTGIIPAIADAGDLILADKLVHASIIDALKLGSAKWLRFNHNDLEHLEKLLRENRAKYRRVLIVTESVFSMDGDRASLRVLVDLKNKYDTLLYVDEAHSFGVFGARGLGLCEEENVIAQVDFIMCTLGKALAGEGACVICSSDFRELLINKARSFIFTTALPPINVMWTTFIFNKMMYMTNEREHLLKMSERLRDALKNYEIFGDTQIIPICLGDSLRALKIAGELFKDGIFAPAIRYPTVALNKARIRFSLSATLSEDDIDLCADKCKKLFDLL